MLSRYITVSSAFDSKEEAEKVLGMLLDRHLVSCGQIGNIQSTYWWNNKIESGAEFLLTCKTRRRLFKQIRTIIKQNHSYEVCQIIAQPIMYGEKEFLKWIHDCTTQPNGKESH